MVRSRADVDADATTPPCARVPRRGAARPLRKCVAAPSARSLRAGRLAGGATCCTSWIKRVVTGLAEERGAGVLVHFAEEPRRHVGQFVASADRVDQEGHDGGVVGGVGQRDAHLVRHPVEALHVVPGKGARADAARRTPLGRTPEGQRLELSAATRSSLKATRGAAVAGEDVLQRRPGFRRLGARPEGPRRQAWLPRPPPRRAVRLA